MLIAPAPRVIAEAVAVMKSLSVGLFVVTPLASIWTRRRLQSGHVALTISRSSAVSASVPTQSVSVGLSAVPASFVAAKHGAAGVPLGRVAHAGRAGRPNWVRYLVTSASAFVSGRLTIATILPPAEAVEGMP